MELNYEILLITDKNGSFVLFVEKEKLSPKIIMNFVQPLSN